MTHSLFWRVKNNWLKRRLVARGGGESCKYLWHALQWFAGLGPLSMIEPPWGGFAWENPNVPSQVKCAQNDLARFWIFGPDRPLSPSTSMPFTPYLQFATYCNYEFLRKYRKNLRQFAETFEKILLLAFSFHPNKDWSLCLWKHGFFNKEIHHLDKMKLPWESKSSKKASAFF